MYTLKNDSLSVSIMDPIADRAHFGTRYCTGGYIYQIDDAQRGPLLSGAQYPGPFLPFNGQGMPDAFNLAPLSEPATGAAQALIIGIGLCNLEKDEVIEFCKWDIEQSAAAITMGTTQAHQGYALELERTLTLTNRTLRSATSLKNTGKGFFPIRWFPHPFYPQPETDELCRFNIPVYMGENDGYTMAADGWISRKNWPAQPSFFLALDHGAQANLTVLQKHKVLGLVAATCSYVPSFFPIWGNLNTFSWEPFYERSLAPGQTTAWWIDYEF